ncbi:DUF6252 family protein [Flavobacterium sp. 1355]|uniref:DUF6252 family protein n=1 Tax=Flavobacterium sp. 1355 TaxID=2806571 RepID=UPI001AE33A40|nr:DUF6252 family protein [Flavobacterium sp. 1355]MBP1225780.1 hypothetical protein [Flavobacterium sp. 1355]
MTKIKLIAFVLFTALITSCSSDDNKEDESAESYFNLTYNNEVKTVTTWEALKQGDHIEVTGTSTQGVAIDFKFNVYGNLYQSFTHGATANSDLPYMEASENFTANTFTFTLEDLNIKDKTVQVKFSGKVYENAYDLESESVIISGSFKVSYKEIDPLIPGQGTFAKIDGKDWHGLSMSTSTTDGVKMLNIDNDSEYNFAITLPDDSESGAHTFTNNSEIKVAFQKYDVTIKEYVDYEVAGTITYTTISDYYVAGTFSLTATHPTNGSKIVISNGTFKEGVPLF